MGTGAARALIGSAEAAGLLEAADPLRADRKLP
jgi:hypothetical protein